MMNGSHQKDATAGSVTAFGVTIPTGLQNDGGCFHDKDAAGDDEDQGLMNQDRDDAERASQGKRAGVAHEHLRRMAVKPKETKAGADHGGAENSQFTGADDMIDLQIFGSSLVSGEVGEHGEDEGNDKRAPDSQAVQAIGEIDRV